MPKGQPIQFGNNVEQYRSRLKKLQVDGGAIAYFDEGPKDGTPIVLVHGMPTSSYLYRNISTRLAKEGFRAIAPDLLGFGASDKPEGHEIYSVTRQSERIVQLLDHLDIASAIFVVHDLGGPWSFEIADRHPERVAGLVILNTSAYADLMKPPLQARMVGGPFGPLMMKMMGSKIGKPMIHKFFADFTGTGKALEKEVTQAHWLPLHEGGTRAFLAFARELTFMMSQFARYSQALKRIDVPATIIWGAKDPVLRHEKMIPRFAADLGIDPKDIRVIENASHFLQEECFEAVVDGIVHFIDLNPHSPSLS